MAPSVQIAGNMLTSIASDLLVTIAGGAGATNGSFADYTNAQRGKIADAYRSVVCTTAGIQGAPELANGVYGKGATDADKIRASEMLNRYCLGGAQLPAKAPKAPF